MKAIYKVTTMYHLGDEVTRNYNVYNVLAENMLDAVAKTEGNLEKFETVDEVVLMTEIDII